MPDFMQWWVSINILIRLNATFIIFNEIWLSRYKFILDTLMDILRYKNLVVTFVQGKSLDEYSRLSPTLMHSNTTNERRST